MTESNAKSLLEMARGAIQERFDYEMSKVIDNIRDENTKATTKRKLTLVVEITPDDNREIFTVSASAKSTLAPTTPVTTALYLNEQDGEACAVEMVAQNPYQQSMFGEDQEPPAVLKLVKEA